MYLQNPFTEKTRELFRDAGVCFVCLLAGCDSLHHILGRESNSPFNACPIHNHGCHFEKSGKLSRMETKLLNRTFHYLRTIGYVPTKKDIEFVESNLKVYKLYPSSLAWLKEKTIQ